LTVRLKATLRFDKYISIESFFLGHLSKDSAAIRERYLFDNDCYAGVCFESGLYSFIWKSPQDFASVMRGEMLIETVSLVANSEIRRAA